MVIGLIRIRTGDVAIISKLTPLQNDSQLINDKMKKGFFPAFRRRNRITEQDIDRRCSLQDGELQKDKDVVRKSRTPHLYVAVIRGYVNSFT